MLLSSCLTKRVYRNQRCYRKVESVNTKNTSKNTTLECQPTRCKSEQCRNKPSTISDIRICEIKRAKKVLTVT